MWPFWFGILQILVAVIEDESFFVIGKEWINLSIYRRIISRICPDAFAWNFDEGDLKFFTETRKFHSFVQIRIIIFKWSPSTP